MLISLRNTGYPSSQAFGQTATADAQFVSTPQKLAANPIGASQESTNTPKKGFLSKTLTVIGLPKKAIVTALKGWNWVAEGVKGIVGGTVKGLVYGTGVYAIAWLANQLKKSHNDRHIMKDIGNTIKWAANGTWNGIKKLHPKKFEFGLLDILKSPFKGTYNYSKSIMKGEGVGKLGKTVVAAIALGTFAYNVIGTKLNINKRNAEVDHAWNTGHKVNE